MGRDTGKTKAQLINELEHMRRRTAELEALEIKRKQADGIEVASFTNIAEATKFIEKNVHNISCCFLGERIGGTEDAIGYPQVLRTIEKHHGIPTILAKALPGNNLNLPSWASKVDKPKLLEPSEIQSILSTKGIFFLSKANERRYSMNISDYFSSPFLQHAVAEEFGAMVNQSAEHPFGTNVKVTSRGWGAWIEASEFGGKKKTTLLLLMPSEQTSMIEHTNVKTARLKNLGGLSLDGEESTLARNSAIIYYDDGGIERNFITKKTKSMSKDDSLQTVYADGTGLYHMVKNRSTKPILLKISETYF